jgi:urocanate hydratase
LGLCFRKPEDLKTDTIACEYWKKWQNSSIEIQQQMQDNIQWIKAHKKIN